MHTVEAAHQFNFTEAHVSEQDNGNSLIETKRAPQWTAEYICILSIGQLRHKSHAKNNPYGLKGHRPDGSRESDENIEQEA